MNNIQNCVEGNIKINYLYLNEHVTNSFLCLNYNDFVFINLYNIFY